MWFPIPREICLAFPGAVVVNKNLIPLWLEEFDREEKQKPVAPFAKIPVRIPEYIGKDFDPIILLDSFPLKLQYSSADGHLLVLWLNGVRFESVFGFPDRIGDKQIYNLDFQKGLCHITATQFLQWIVYTESSHHEEKGSISRRFDRVEIFKL